MDLAGCQPCPAGYLCFGGTNTNVPKNVTVHRGEKCQKGAFCIEGSYEAQYCKPGSYNPLFA